MAMSGPRYYSPSNGSRDRAPRKSWIFRITVHQWRDRRSSVNSRGTHSFQWLLLCSWIALAFTQASIAKSQQIFAFKVVTSSEDAFWTNSVIIEGHHEVMLVDAQLTKTNAEKVLQQIQATNKPLSIIYITHEHADHFLGLEVFKDAYPTVRILANSHVADRISDVYQAKIDKWKGILGSAATSHVVPISKYDDSFIRFDNARIEIMKNIQGDTDERSM